VLEKGKKNELQRVEGTVEPTQIFPLTNPCDNSHSLLNVAEVRLCKEDFGVEIVTGTLYTSSQR